MHGTRDTVVVGFSPGQLSGLVFACANQHDDGVMTADEIAFLRLRDVQLAVLSACETGLGETAGGEGLLGLQRSFHIAGAKTVAASLSKVDDLATRSLMTEFYTNLLDREMSALGSLRQAQLKMLREYDRTTGMLRGLGKTNPANSIDVTKTNESSTTSNRLSPKFWAPFVLSGDWR